MEKKFKTHCDYCGEETDNFGVFNEWQQYEPDTIELKVCLKCQLEESRKKMNKSLDKRI